jgi:hypothetical protein
MVSPATSEAAIKTGARLFVRVCLLYKIAERIILDGNGGASQSIIDLSFCAGMGLTLDIGGGNLVLRV